MVVEIRSTNVADLVSYETITLTNGNGEGVIRYSTSVCFFALLAASTSAAANVGDPSEAVRQSFSPEAFTQFAPRSALDMVEQIPGFTVREGGGERGFGQADTNVLVNGRRISGKSNGPIETLRRIPADDVVRLDIVDGASLDISGLSGQVLNVVTSGERKFSGQFRYSPTFRSRGAPFRWGDGEISASGGSEKVEWTVSLQNEQGRFGDEGPEFAFDSNDILFDTRQERRNESIDRPALSGSLARTASNGNILNVSGRASGFLLDVTEVSERSGPSDVDRTRIFRDSEDEFFFEIGADYEFELAGGRLKFIGLHSDENSPKVSSVLVNFADDSAPEGSVFTRQQNERESILRTEYTFGLLGGDWQWSLEGARNFLEIVADVEERDENGDLQIVEFPGSTSRVDEDRAETTLSYSRSLTDNLQMQTSLGIEYSEISQSGEFGLVRDFVRPKGFFSLNWKATDALNLSAKLERAVGQLRFSDFVASRNINDDREDVTNANLVPPQSWLLELELQQSLGDFGALTLRGFAEDITDIVDQIPIEGGGQAPGNIDSANRYGGELNLTFLTDPIGWKGARFDVNLEYTDSEVVDPLLGTTRRLSDEELFEVEVEFRQDIKGTNWATGFFVRHNENTPSVRLDEVSIFKQNPPFSSIFVENKDVFGLTTRFRLGNLFNRRNEFFRTIFNDRINNDIAFREERSRTFGTIFRFDIEGSF